MLKTYQVECCHHHHYLVFLWPHNRAERWSWRSHPPFLRCRCISVVNNHKVGISIVALAHCHEKLVVMLSVSMSPGHMNETYILCTHMTNHMVEIGMHWPHHMIRNHHCRPRLWQLRLRFIVKRTRRKLIQCLLLSSILAPNTIIGLGILIMQRVVDIINKFSTSEWLIVCTGIFKVYLCSAIWQSTWGFIIIFLFLYLQG